MIKEIDDIINIVNLSRSARNKANIKVRQPLSNLYIYTKDDISETVLRNEQQIKDELNIKSINIVNNLDMLLSYKVKPNFALLSQKYSSSMKEIVAFINKSNQNNLVNDLEKNKKISIKLESEDIEILEEELIVEEVPKNDLCINSNREFKIGIDINITEELKMEGIVRDLIRHVQNLRKKSNLEVSDRIGFGIISNKDVVNSMYKFEDYFKNETLIEHITEDISSLNFNEKFKIDGINVEIYISKV